MNNEDLQREYLEHKICFQEHYAEIKENGFLGTFMANIFRFQDELAQRRLPIVNYCSICKKSWVNDEYCPHSFDEKELWKLYRRAYSGKMRFSLANGECKKMEFWDRSGNFVGEYITKSE